MDFNKFVSLRLDAYRLHPRMWGSSNETIEALALQLIEAEIRHYKPEAYEERPRNFMDHYTRELARRYGSGILPLYARAPELVTFEFERVERDFDQALFEICHKVRTLVRAELGLEPPFEVLEIHRLEHYLQLTFPDSASTLSRPLRAADTWTLDVIRNKRWLVLTWMAPNHFSVSEADGNTLYGEGPAEVFDNYEIVLNRVVKLLSDKPKKPKEEAV